MTHLPMHEAVAIRTNALQVRQSRLMSFRHLADLHCVVMNLDRCLPKGMPVRLYWI
ncbi:MAG: hypothetical protein K0S57_1363 [Ramlibacter sp.]|nr:hypothetical protein [Ramlibacter sp.]